MENKSIKCKLENIILLANTGLDAIKRAPIVKENTGIKCLRIQDVSQKKEFFDWGYCSVTEANFNKFKLIKNDILIARTGATVGKNFIITTDLSAVYNNGLIKIKIDEKVANPRFIYYVLQSKDFSSYIHSISGGTVAQPNIKISELLKYEIMLPSLKEQDRISGILTIMDEKIQNNDAIVANLEKYMQLLYKQWFLDFQFLNDKGIGYKSDNGQFKESNIGLIPVNFEIIKLSEKLDFEKGVEPGNKNYKKDKEDGDILFIRTGDLLSPSNNYVSKDFCKNKLAAPSDVLVAFDGAIGRMAYGLSGAYSGGIRKISSKKIFFPNSMIYCLFKTDYIQNEINKYESSRTTIAHASGAINDFEIAYSEEVARKLAIIIQPMFDQMINLKLENDKLAETRDYLLPKLMSGEIKVKMED